MREKFDISFGPANRAFHDVSHSEARLSRGIERAFDCGGPPLVIAHDPSFADPFSADLELRFDQNDCFTTSLKNIEHGRKYQAERNERNVDADKRDVIIQVAASQVAGIDPLAYDYAGIPAQLLVELPVADVNRVNP